MADLPDPMPFMYTGQSIRVTKGALAALLIVCQHARVDLMAQSTAQLDFDRSVQQEAMGYRWLRWSTERIGHRLTGSRQGTLAENAADSMLRLSGLPLVQRFPFTATAWMRGSIQLTIGDGDGFAHMPAVALANTPTSSHAEAAIVDVGDGLAEDLASLGGVVRGRTALINLGLVDAAAGRKNLHRSEKASLALEAGAAAILFVNQAEGGVLLTGTASIDGSLIDIPAACISSEDGRALRDRLQAGESLTARLSMSNTSAVVRAHNIIAEIPGSTKPEEVILVGGHLDSWDLASGATDNGLGSFSILDLARAMAASPIKPERTVRFVLFMGEEQGLLGSRALVASYSKGGDLEKIRCMINLDMSGNPQGFGVGGPEGWGALMTQACAEIRTIDSSAFEGRATEAVWLHSDHQPFLLHGVPVIYPLSDLGKHVYGCYHSSCDDIHLVDPQAMVNNVRFVGALVYWLAGRRALPGHFSEEVLRARLRAEGLEQPLRIGGDWPWE